MVVLMNICLNTPGSSEIYTTEDNMLFFDTIAEFTL